MALKGFIETKNCRRDKRYHLIGVDPKDPESLGKAASDNSNPVCPEMGTPIQVRNLGISRKDPEIVNIELICNNAACPDHENLF